MLSTDRGDDRDRARSLLTRILLVLHGAEPAGWASEACRVLGTWRNPAVRVLVVPIVPCPPFTSVLPAARRRFAGGRAAWHAEEEERILATVDRVRGSLPRSIDVVRARCTDVDPVAAVDEQARQYAADVVVVGAPPPGLGSWLWPGPVHERVLRRVACAVLVVPAPPTSTAATRRRLAAEPAGQRPGVAHGSV